MFFTARQIVDSISALSSVHPFHGITFLACKKAKLPVGQTIQFALDSETAKFLEEHHRLDPSSAFFFQPFKSSDAKKKWVNNKYPSSGLQAINTQTFGTAFMHEPNTRIWGWASTYVAVLAAKLNSQKKIPTLDLATWLYRDHDWSEGTQAEDVLDRFLADYSISLEEQAHLFESRATSLRSRIEFQPSKVTWDDLRPLLPPAPDAKPDEGGTLAYLETRGLGPAAQFVLEPARRLSLITGDNGLGKSFLLESAWWALTGTWADLPMYPNLASPSKRAEITFTIAGEQSRPNARTIEFDWKTMSWPATKKRPTISGLIVFARVDGSFAVWDPARQLLASPDSSRVLFSHQDAWNGLPGRIEGLVRDWVRWQNSKGPQFETFRKVLSKLSPPDLGQLEPGETIRIPNDPRDIPTLIHSYGSTPIVYASAGVRRIITLAYLIVWAWYEHVVAADMGKTAPQRRMVVLMDEMEAHLHPKWQRALLPALLDVSEMLAPALETQYLVATHSPLIMASSETIFTAETDKLFHLDLDAAGAVSLEEMEYVKFGDISSWLTSPIFELRHARSTEGEAAIENAKKLQLQASPSKEEVAAATESLRRSLAETDRFWPRWIAFAERFGVAV